MRRMITAQWFFTLLSIILAAIFVLGACNSSGAAPVDGVEQEHTVDSAHSEELPDLAPVALAAGEKLRVVATTNIVADVVAQIGGEHIELSGLMPVGADPHSYASTPQDLRTLNEAHVIFINGLGLEEALLPVLENVDGGAPLVAVNAGIDTLEFGDEGREHAETGAGEGEEAREEPGEEAHLHEGVDPHTWFHVPNVMVWAENIEHVLSELDPANAGAYADAADSYIQQLEQLDAELQAAIASIPVEERKLVTDHDALGYLAASYQLQIIGAVFPSFSTMASPSAQELAALQDQIMAEGVKAIFVGTTVNPQLASQIASDLGIEVVSLYTDSLSMPDGPAPTYLDLMRYAIHAIVEALQ